MTADSQRELQNTREKLRVLESMHGEAVAETDGDPEVREAELESLQRHIKQLKEEVVRYELGLPPRQVRMLQNETELANTREKLRSLGARYEELGGGTPRG